MKKYKIKTEEEFENEYGHRWKRKVQWNSEDSMDYLFGLVLTEDQNEIMDVVLQGKQHSLGLEQWSIFSKMVKETSSFTVLNDNLINSRKKILLNQNN